MGAKRKNPRVGVQARLWGPWWGPGEKPLTGVQDSTSLCKKICIWLGKLQRPKMLNFRPYLSSIYIIWGDCTLLC